MHDLRLILQAIQNGREELNKLLTQTQQYQEVLLRRIAYCDEIEHGLVKLLEEPVPEIPAWVTEQGELGYQCFEGRNMPQEERPPDSATLFTFRAEQKLAKLSEKDAQRLTDYLQGPMHAKWSQETHEGKVYTFFSRNDMRTAFAKVLGIVL